MTATNKKINILPHTVLLEWDGTLVDSYEFLKSAHNFVRGEYGYKLWDDMAFKEVMRKSTREAFADLYGEHAEEIREKLFAYVDDNHVHSLVIMDGAEELLKLLNKAGVKVGVVSNKRHERLAGDIIALGWQKYISAAVGAGAAERDKPAPDPILMALGQMNVNHDSQGIWFIGDTSTDLECAIAADVTSIYMLHGVGGKELAERYRPSYVFEDLKDLAIALDGIISHRESGKERLPHDRMMVK